MYKELHFYLISMFVLNAMCTLKNCLRLDLFVIVKLCTCSTCHGTFISLDIQILIEKES